MKISILITALAITCGAAAAQTGGSSSAERDAATHRANTTASVTDKDSGGTAGEKGKNFLQRIGEATRNAWHKITRSGKSGGDTEQASSKSDTRSMGASGTDSARKQRMDDAYNDFNKSKNKGNSSQGGQK
jgi:hypothetical protein